MKMRPQQLFAAFYPRQCSLTDYLSDIKDRLHHPDDAETYNDMLKQTIVCYHGKQVDLCSFAPRVREGFHMRDVIQRVIEISCHSLSGCSGNIISTGYHLVRDSNNSTGCAASSTATVVSKYPNSMVEFLSSKCWQVLHKRIGDDLMIHLLKDVSMFVMVKNSCYMQVTGCPMYNLGYLKDEEMETNKTVFIQGVPEDVSVEQQAAQYKVHQESVCLSLPVQQHIQGVQLQAVQDLVSQESTNLILPVQQDIEGVQQQAVQDLVSQGSTILSMPEQYIPLWHQQLYLQNQQITTVQEESGQEKIVNKPTLKVILQHNNVEHGVSEQYRGILQRPFTERMPLPMECSASEDFLQNMHVSVSDSLDDVYLATESRKSSRGENELKEQVTRINKITKRKISTPPFKEPSKKVRCLNFERPESKSSKPKGRSLSFCSNISNLCFPQPAIMYSTNCRNRFPNRHVLSSTSASKRGAVKLIEEIFMGSNFVFDNKNNQARIVAKKSLVRKEGEKEKKAQRLPKRFVKMKGLFQRILQRHKKCRFNALLKHHCKGTDDLSKKGENLVGIQQNQAEIPEKPDGIQEEHAGTPETSTGIQEKLVEIQKVQNKVEEKVGMKDKFSKFPENFHEKHNVDNRDDSKRKVLAAKQQEYDRAVQNFTPPFQVVRFLTAVCNRVIPKELWGSLKNKKTFYNNLKDYVTLNKGEKYSLGQIVQGIKLKDCEWLKCTGREGKGIPLSESEKQREVFYKWMWWLVRRYIMIILKTFFYITENASQTREIFFYRKPVWKVINDFGVAAMESDILKPLTAEEAGEILTSKSSLGYSHMRFLPKAQTVRPIINMKHHPLGASGDQKFQASINVQLRNLFEIIKYEKSREPVGADSTVFGTDDVYQALTAFHSRRKESDDERSLYMVHVDINKCFDSIPFEKLYCIMEDVFNEEEYLVRRFASIKSVNNVARKIFNRKVSSGEDCRSFKHFLEDMIQEKNLNNVIFIDQVYYSCEERDNILALLKKHLFSNIVKIGCKFYKQAKGISQGSILSTYLCSYFYSHMEKRYLQQQMQDQSSLLMRWVDDFLFLSPTRDLADGFLRIMLSGIPEYGCQMTSRKTLVNFETTISDGFFVRCVGQDEAFPWCGFLIHPKSLETKLDSSKREGKNKISVLRNLQSRPGRNLFEKLRYSLVNKSHPLLLDTVINSYRTVLLNIYEAFFQSACKFYNYSRDFTKGRRLQENPSFSLRVIMALPHFYCAQAKMKFKKLKQNSQKSRQHGFDVRYKVVAWLCYRAFARYLKTKPSFKLVVRALRKRFRNLVGKNTDLPQSIFNPIPTA